MKWPYATMVNVVQSPRERDAGTHDCRHDCILIQKEGLLGNFRRNYVFCNMRIAYGVVFDADCSANYPRTTQILKRIYYNTTSSIFALYYQNTTLPQFLLFCCRSISVNDLIANEKGGHLYMQRQSGRSNNLFPIAISLPSPFSSFPPFPSQQALPPAGLLRRWLD